MLKISIIEGKYLRFRYLPLIFCVYSARSPSRLRCQKWVKCFTISLFVFPKAYEPVPKNIGARYKRIRKRPRGKLSPQLYAYKKEKLQELEELDSKGELMLYYADESHVCTNGYVPYGWQFKNEDIYIPSEKAARLNIFGMITKRNQYKGFTTQESINADKIVDYLDRFSFNVTKKTVIVLDNASVHRNRKVKELRKIWEKRGLFLFYLPPYSPELNPAEILWRILKGKWIRPIDYETTDSLFYCTNLALASVGTNLFVNYSYL